jgi:MFS family permease
MGPFVLFAPFAGVIVDRFSRRKIMIATDLMRAVIALGYLLVGRPDQLWIAYLSGALLSSVGVFFEGARTASLPNLARKHELLPANALMYSTRFLQLTMGAATGGIVSEHFGYKVAFIVNSLSFVVSAYFIWRIPEKELKQNETETTKSGDAGHLADDLAVATESVAGSSVSKFFDEISAGLRYIRQTPLILGFIIMNIGWATGGGAGNLIYDRFGGHVYKTGANGDTGVATLYTSVGLGLVIAMFVARWVGVWVERNGITNLFIGVAMIVHGLFFAAGGLVNSLMLMAFCIFASRFVIGVEFAIQETLMMQVIPDELRGRVFVTDRSLEIAMMMLSMLVTGYAFTVMQPKHVVIISGLLSASPGVMWLIAHWTGRLVTNQNTIVEGAAVSPSAAD